MKILSYKQLIQLQETLPARKPKLFSEPQLNLSAWQNELIAVLGPRKSGEAFFRNLFRQTKLAGATNAMQQLLHKLADQDYLLDFSETLYENIYKVLETAQPDLGITDKLILTEQYIHAAYLQAYAANFPAEVSKLVKKQAILALQFAASTQIVAMPDIFKDVAFSDKALLQRTIQNLRHIQQQPRIIFFQTQQPDEAIYLADRILVLTGEPDGVVGESIPVCFHEPRNRWIISQLPAFRVIRKELIKLLTDTYANEDLFIYTPNQLIS